MPLLYYIIIEKSIVLNMIRMAATGELEGAGHGVHESKPSEQDFRYIWAPGNSQAQYSDHYSYLQSDDDFDFDAQHDSNKASLFGAGLQDPEPQNAPFKFPEHDTVIKTARQLSNLASRQSSRAERHLQEMGLPQRSAYSAEPRLVTPGGRQHSRSASFTGNGPTLTGNFKSKSHQARARSRSANAPNIGGRANDERQYPPPPVRVSVSKENIQTSKPGSARAKLRYTSHWD
jgi:hypothetical protein